MPKLDLSTKRLAITKANAQMVILVAVASFVSVFCLIASQAVWNNNRYQAKVISGKEKAHRQLEANLEAYKDLAKSYASFNAKDPNSIGGAKSGSGDDDGENAKIILDALPSSYDFPALTSSLEKILASKGLKVSEISGTDDQLNQETNNTSPSPRPVEMPFAFTVTNASYGSVKDLLASLELSIRPLQVDSITVSGGATNMSLTVDGHTYYQPGKNLNITTKVLKK
jgi:hypothetical protein